MTKGQEKKLNIALHLNPTASQADAAALGALQEWFGKAKQGQGATGEAELEAAVRALHHDVYLAGLHLYLINPQFCRQFGNALEPKTPTVDGLMQQLQACGLAPAASPAAASEAVFSDAQLEQLAQLKVEASAPASSDDVQLSRQLLEQGEQLKELSEELKALRTLAENQYAELQRLQSSAANTPSPASSGSPEAEEMDVAGMEPQIAQMQKIRAKGVF